MDASRLDHIIRSLAGMQPLSVAEARKTVDDSGYSGFTRSIERETRCCNNTGGRDGVVISTPTLEVLHRPEVKEIPNSDQTIVFFCVDAHIPTPMLRISLDIASCEELVNHLTACIAWMRERNETFRKETTR